MIAHILEEQDWIAAKDKMVYYVDTLKSQGFIHCSGINQIVKVANYNYKGTKNMLMMVIDELLLISEVKLSMKICIMKVRCFLMFMD